MKVSEALNKDKQLLGKNRISYRLVLFTLLFSSIITFFITFIQLYMDYREGLKNIDQQLELVESSYLASIKQSIWVYDSEQLKLQMEGMLSLPDIRQVQVNLAGDKVIKMGDTLSQSIIQKEFNLNFNHNNRNIPLGTIIISADLKHLYEYLRTKILVILFSQGIKTFLTAFFILFLVQYLITRHLSAIANYSRGITLKGSSEPLQLKKTIRHDELDDVALAVNEMQELITFEAESLEQLNNELEQRIKNRTAELTSQKEVFEQLFYAASDAIIISEMKQFTDCNEAAIKLFHYQDKNQLIGKNTGNISPPKQPDCQNSFDKSKQLLKQTLETGQTRFEWMFQRYNGDYFWCDVSLTKIVIDSKDIIHITLRDISEQKALQEANDLKSQQLQRRYNQLKDTQNQLIQAEKMAALGEMVAGVAHEINTPVGVGVTGITYLSEYTKQTKTSFAKQELSKKQFEEYLDTAEELSSSIYFNLENAAKLIASFKKIAVNQSHEFKSYFSAKAYLEEILLSLKSKLKKTKVKVTLICDEHLQIYSDPGAIAQIITNLIINSLMHGFDADAEGEITIAVSTTEEEIMIHYHDSGKGIAEEVLPKIFDPFFTTNRQAGGTGLGLNIIFNIICTQLGGHIEAKSKKGQGTDFFIALPAKPDESDLTPTNSFI